MTIESTRHLRKARREPQLVQVISASTRATSPRLAQAARSARSKCRNNSRSKPVIASGLAWRRGKVAQDGGWLTLPQEDLLSFPRSAWECRLRRSASSNPDDAERRGLHSHAER